MDAKKRKRLEEGGWKVGGTGEFLGLIPSEMEFVDLKLALAKDLAETRKAQKLTQSQLAHRLQSSQSRVAKMEAGDASVSLDLIVRSLLELRFPRKGIKKSLRISLTQRSVKSA